VLHLDPVASTAPPPPLHQGVSLVFYITVLVHLVHHGQ